MTQTRSTGAGKAFIATDRSRRWVSRSPRIRAGVAAGATGFLHAGGVTGTCDPGAATPVSNSPVPRGHRAPEFVSRYILSKCGESRRIIRGPTDRLTD